jgi:citrate lyase beta subunit
VAADRKHPARELIEAELRDREVTGPAVYVRSNRLASAEGEADVALLRGLSIDAVVVPKATAAELEVYPLDAPVIALIETARGLIDLPAIAAHPAVARLQLGAEDLRLELQLGALPDRAELDFARSQLVLHSAAAKLHPPLDAVHSSLADPDGLVRDCRRARALGFSGKACIHPRHLETVNRAFSVQPDELRWAKRVVDMAEASNAAIAATPEEMIDAPILERARRILIRAGADS